MDFCCQCGKEHIIGSRYWLTRTNKPLPKPVEPEPEPVVEEKEPSHLDMIRMHMGKGWPELLSLGMGVNKSNHFGGDIV
jgi:hypothetical protein